MSCSTCVSNDSGSRTRCLLNECCSEIRVFLSTLIFFLCSCNFFHSCFICSFCLSRLRNSSIKNSFSRPNACVSFSITSLLPTLFGVFSCSSRKAEKNCCCSSVNARFFSSYNLHSASNCFCCSSRSWRSRSRLIRLSSFDSSNLLSNACCSSSLT